jgi:hypothetical protein
MNQPSIRPAHSRKPLLDQLAELSTMERGTLAEEYRERPASEGGGTVRLGPYFKHQCWENGRNMSRRVPAAEVDHLREDLQNAQRFDQIISELASMAVDEGRTRRAALRESAQSQPIKEQESKKNSGKRRWRNATAKPKPSSLKSRRGSKKKA